MEFAELPEPIWLAEDWVTDNLDDRRVGRFTSGSNAGAWSALRSSWDEDRRGKASTW